LQYTKLFQYLTHNEIWEEPAYVRIVWITLISLANKNYCVTETPMKSFIAHSNLLKEECEDALELLIEKGIISQNLTGWKINQFDPVDIAKKDDRREYQKSKMREYRSKITGTSKKKLVVKNKPKKAVKKATNCEAWEAYSHAYWLRYGVEPVRNQKTNAQMTAFIKRIGVNEAPGIAEFYISNNSHYYVQKLHPVGILLQEAEKLRTEFITKTQVSTVQAKIVDRQMATKNAFQKLLDQLEN